MKALSDIFQNVFRFGLATGSFCAEACTQTGLRVYDGFIVYPEAGNFGFLKNPDFRPGPGKHFAQELPVNDE